MGSPQVINCTVSTVSGVESSSVIISWMGPGGNIDATNDRVTIGSITAGGNNMYTRSLQFDYLMEGDEANYTCNVIILETSESQSVELESLSSRLSLTFCHTCSYFLCISDYVIVSVNINHLIKGINTKINRIDSDVLIL